MTKQELIKYARNMKRGEKVFAILYSWSDVKEWFEREGQKCPATLPEIYDELGNWESSFDLACTTCLANDFDELCQKLANDKIRRN